MRSGDSQVSQPADSVSTQPVKCCGSLVSCHFCRINFFQITTFRFGDDGQKLFSGFNQDEYCLIGKMMISYDGWCRAARQGCLPTGNYGSASRPDPTIPYSCQTQLSRPYTQNHPDTPRIVVPYTLQTSIHTRLGKTYTRAHLAYLGDQLAMQLKLGKSLKKCEPINLQS